MNRNLILALVVSIIGVTGLLFGVFYVIFPSPRSQIPEFQYDVEVAFQNISFNRPVGIYHAGDGTNRLFVLEQDGVIYVFKNYKDVNAATVFLDIRDWVESGGEKGLLGLAFIRIL